MLDQEKMEEFSRIKEFLKEAEIEAEILKKGEALPDTVLLVCLPTAALVPKDRELTEEDLHLAAGYLLNLDDMDQELAKYLMFYSQIAVNVQGMSRLEILSMVNELNRTVRIGHYFYGPADGKEEEMLQYRVTVAGVEGQPLDEGIVADALLEMGVGYDVALQVFEKRQVNA